MTDDPWLTGQPAARTKTCKRTLTHRLGLAA